MQSATQRGESPNPFSMFADTESQGAHTLKSQEGIPALKNERALEIEWEFNSMADFVAAHQQELA